MGNSIVMITISAIFVLFGSYNPLMGEVMVPLKTAIHAVEEKQQHKPFQSELFFYKQVSEKQKAEILLNGVAMVDGVLVFEPGLLNIVKVKPDWNLISSSELKSILVKTLPDGRKQKFHKKVVQGERVEISLGPMTAPPIYNFRAGDVYQSGYSIEIELKEEEAKYSLLNMKLSQGLSDIATTVRTQGFNDMKSGRGRLIEGQDRSILFNPMYGIKAPLELRIHKNVLLDQDDLRIQLRLNPGAPVNHLSGRLHVTNPEGDLLVDRKVTLEQSSEWKTELLNPDNWDLGDYTVALYPKLEGRLWYEGPKVDYRRRDIDQDAISISPVAPWTLIRDNTREKINVKDLHEAVQQYSDEETEGWEYVESSEGTSVVNKPGIISQPLRLDFPVSGTYAVFVKPYSDDGIVMQTGDDRLVRIVRGIPGHGQDFMQNPWTDDLIYVDVADLGHGPISLYGFSRETERSSMNISGLQQLVLIPVTPESIDDLYNKTSNPPIRLHGVNDWADYFHTGDGSVRLHADQFETLLEAQAELGMNLDWSIGRSWVEYDSQLPEASRFPTVPYEEAVRLDLALARYHPRIIMINEYDPLDEVLEKSQNFDKKVTPWLAMNRHYGMDAYGGMFSSQWFKENSQWWQWQKNASSPRGSAVSYFFPEVRKERINIFHEVIERGAGGVLVGTTRQVPMLLYNPEMVDAYRQETDINPLEIDAENLEEYTDWITWRADFFTEFLRELRETLKPLEERRGSRIKVSVRIPSSGLDWNLAQGLDVEQWLEERLIDRLQLVPLEERGGKGVRSHDITPYINLGCKYDITVFGGIGSTWAWGPESESVVPSLYRALGLLEAGVDGIEIYEANDHAVSQYIRWVLPLIGNMKKTLEFLDNSNIEAVYPVTASTAMYGYDNHSRWSASGWDIYGMDGAKL